MASPPPILPLAISDADLTCHKVNSPPSAQQTPSGSKEWSPGGPPASALKSRLAAALWRQVPLLPPVTLKRERVRLDTGFPGCMGGAQWLVILPSFIHSSVSTFTGIQLGAETQAQKRGGNSSKGERGAHSDSQEWSRRSMQVCL